MILRVNDLPPSLNKVLRMHWTKKRALLNAWVWMIRCAYLYTAGVELKPTKRKVKITLFHSRLFDVDNAYGACKVVFDAMKAERLIVDDSKEWLDADVQQEICPHKERHTIIEMEEG